MRERCEDTLVICNTTQTKNTTVVYPSPDGFFDMGAFRNLSVQFSLTGDVTPTVTDVTLTVEGSNGSGDWVDITKAGYDVVNNTLGNASFATSGGGTLNGIVDFDEIHQRYVRVKLVTSNGTDDSGTNKITIRRTGSRST